MSKFIFGAIWRRMNLRENCQSGRQKKQQWTVLISKTELSDKKGLVDGLQTNKTASAVIPSDFFELSFFLPNTQNESRMLQLPW